jgi:site-specific recombinase XerD
MRYPAEVLTKREIGALLEACGTKTWTARRNRALIVVMYRAGLRLAEALALRPCDVDAERGAIRVLRGKGGRARTVGIDRWGLEELVRWADERGAMGWSAGEPLFCSGAGQPLTQAYVRRRLPELARAAGIHKRVHAHGLRHTHAAELRAEGIDLAIIRRQLGHASLLTTVQYLDHLEPESVVNRIGERVVRHARGGSKWPPVVLAHFPA